ncbi:TIGR03862 family flavoprotein [Deefgea tanakiae]|uniref:TIGR03862 family flavoprotein n=1 Tax=Deefgea tanakiae TaxID=2865840 RepID=A0ABX8Z4F5_9NEIS|nr:TIGR03862 family flavoprotein [Deefgea tanakiae]QZA77260.1 TIGR03862 family flavoprotein [Deefgea tanakiae]
MPSKKTTSAKTIAIIGGGPAGLMAAEVIAAAGFSVELFDAMPSVGRKFLLAGVGGMNITHAEDSSAFLGRYGKASADLAPMMADFGANELTAWVHGLGIETFIGSSGRVFPIEMKAAPLLRAWLARLKACGIKFHVRHRWLGWDANKALRFSNPTGEISRTFDAVVLALGGASWAKLGSDGAWVPLLAEQGVSVEPLKPSNCGFDVAWSTHLTDKFAGAPIKTVAAAARQHDAKKAGEFVLTQGGVEGSLVYALSSQLRDDIAESGTATLWLDLVPQKSLARITEELSQPRGADSMANHLRRKLGIEGVKAGLLREIVSKEDFAQPAKLAAAIKSLPITLIAPRPIDEAISSAGGVTFAGLDANLMLSQAPGVFCAGEMLDWEAPTGGYLLTACFSSGRAAGLGAVNWLNSANQVATKKTAKAEAKLETVEVAAKPARKAAKPKVAVEVVDVTSAPAPTEQAAPVVKPKRASKVKVAEVEIETEVKAAKSKRAVKAKIAPEAEVIVTDAAEIVAEVAKPKRTRKAAEPAAPVASEADAVPAKPKRVRKTSQE